MSNEEKKIGHYLKQTLLTEGVNTADVRSLISFVLSIKEKDYDEGFSMSSDVRFALEGIRDEYTALSKFYEPSIEFVCFNSILQKDIIESLKKLAGKRKNKLDKKAIEAIQQNMIIERFMAKVDENTLKQNDSFLGQLLFILKKRRII